MCFGGTVVDDPYFIKIRDAEQDHVVERIVVDRVGVQPAGLPRVGIVVKVDQFGVLAYRTVIGPGGVKILNEVVPHAPLPDDAVGGRVDLDHDIGPKCARGDFGGI